MLLAVSGTAFSLIALPAYADHTSAHATDQIWDIAASGEQEMSGVASGFDAQISAMDDESDVESAEDAADDAIKAIWDEARLSIDALVQKYPSELGPVAGDAKSELQEARQTYRDLVSDLADGWEPPTPTTTIPVVTTTIPSPPVTTPPPLPNPGEGAATPPPTTGGSDNGNHGNGNSNGNSDSNAASGNATPPSDPSPDEEPETRGPQNQPRFPQSGSAAEPSRPDPSALVPVIDMATQTPDTPLILASEATVEATGAGAANRMATLLETVLPPDVVDLLLSPVLIVEILARTILDGGMHVIQPLILLAVFGVGMFLYDRSKRPEPVFDRQ